MLERRKGEEKANFDGTIIIQFWSAKHFPKATIIKISISISISIIITINTTTTIIIIIIISCSSSIISITIVFTSTSATLVAFLFFFFFPRLFTCLLVYHYCRWKNLGGIVKTTPLKEGSVAVFRPKPFVVCGFSDKINKIVIAFQKKKKKKKKEGKNPPLFFGAFITFMGGSVWFNVFPLFFFFQFFSVLLFFLSVSHWAVICKNDC